MLQGIAWVSMFATYSAESGMVQGAVDTFSGDRPCQLCKSIAAAKEPGEHSPEPLPSPRFSQWKMLQDMVAPRVVCAATIFGTDVPFVRYQRPIDFHGNGRNAPPVPPPLMVA